MQFTKNRPKNNSRWVDMMLKSITHTHKSMCVSLILSPEFMRAKTFYQSDLSMDPDKTKFTHFNQDGTIS